MKIYASFCWLTMAAAFTGTTHAQVIGTVKPAISTVSVPLNKTQIAAAKVNINSNQQFINTKATELLTLTGSSSTIPFTFAKTRPTVAVLIHGVTGFPTDNNKIGTLKGTRNYWGYDFVFDLFGGTQDKPTTFTQVDGDLPEIGKPEWETKRIEDFVPTNHFLTIYGQPVLTGNSRFYTPFSVMMTYRDGSVSYKKQVAATAAQIVYLYNTVFGNWPEDKKPQLILLCHSFGGVVARTICSKPNSIPSNNPLIAVENFSENEKKNMEFIRNRTLHITTLSTPHEGSPITWNAALGSVLQYMPFLGPQIDESDPDTYILKQLAVPYMEQINKSILRPELCKRTDGTLIPVHALGGRIPAGPSFFSNPNIQDNDLATVDGGIGKTNIDELADNESNRDKFECYNLLRVDYAMHLFFGGLFGKPWGSVPSDNPKLDIIKVMDVQPVTGCLTPPIYNVASFGVKPRLFYLRNSWSNIAGNIAGVPTPCSFRFSQGTGNVSDGEIDNDGFVPINSSLGVKLGTANKNYFDHTRNWNVNSTNIPAGSWYRFYNSAADFHNHGTIKFSGEIGRWLRENIIGNTPTALLFGTLDRFKAAGPTVGLTGTVSTW